MLNAKCNIMNKCSICFNHNCYWENVGVFIYKNKIDKCFQKFIKDNWLEYEKTQIKNDGEIKNTFRIKLCKSFISKCEAKKRGLYKELTIDDFKKVGGGIDKR